MTLAKITDHTDQAQAHLLSQFSGSPRLRQLVETFAADKGLQELEDVIWAVLTGLVLSAATGKQLDIMGKIAGSVRAELTDDDDYRSIINATIAASLSDSTAEAIAEVASQIFGVHVRYWWAGRANFVLQWEVTTASSETLRARAFDLLNTAKQCGVSMQLVEGDDPSFTLDDDDRGLDQGQLCALLEG